MKIITAFPKSAEYDKMKAALVSLGLPFEAIDPSPGYSRVGCPAIIMDSETRAALSTTDSGTIITSGWVDYRPAAITAPSLPPPTFSTDVFGSASIMVLARCIADSTRVRLIAHLSGDVGPALPYLNTEMREGSYNKDGQTFTFMESYRMITVYPRRISIAKADEIIDGWRILEKIRCRINEIYSRRESIEPSYETRRKPPALEIFKRLPGTNCGKCGQKTCMAFALTLWSGNSKPSLCEPVLSGDYRHLKDAFFQICEGLGLPGDDYDGT